MNKIVKKDLLEWVLLWVALIVLLIAAAMVPRTIHAQTWKGGKTADYDANSVCSDVYLLHAEGTEFPGDTREECCLDTVVSGGWGLAPVEIGDTVIIGSDTIIIDSTTIYIPVITGNSVDTIYFGSDTLVISEIDSIFVMHGNNNTFFTSFSTWTCETLYFIDSFAIYGDDTVLADTSICYFCDSVLNVSWWRINEEGTDTLQFDYWRFLYPSSFDSCSIIDDSPLHIEGDYIDNSVTITNYDTTIIHQHNHFDDIDSSAFYDLVNGWFEDYFNTSGGIWVKDCDCTTSAPTYIVADSFDVFACITTDWQARTTIGGYYPDETSRDKLNPYSQNCNVEDVKIQGTWAIKRSSEYGAYYTLADYGKAHHGSVTTGIHDSYFQDYFDTLTALLSPGDEIQLLLESDEDSTISVFNALYFEYDTSANYEFMIADTNLLANISEDRLAGCFWNSSYLGDFVPGLNFGDRRFAYKFTNNNVDFTSMYTAEEVASIQERQPEWAIFAISDDFMPYVRINGIEYTLDSIPGSAYDYGVHVYRITPELPINYSQPVRIETGVYSCCSPFLGGQMLFSLVYSDSVLSSCYTFRDSITLPDCGIDCADSICFKFPQGMVGQVNVGGGDVGLVGNNVNEVVVCFSTCDVETLDVSGDDHGAIFTLPRVYSLMSPDSTDTFRIEQFNDSLIIQETGTIPIEIRSDVEMGSSDLKFYDTAKNDTTHLYQTADTFHISTNDTSVIVKIGSGSVYISDRALWFGGSTIAHDAYGLALGNSVTTSGDYSCAFGNSSTASGDYAFAMGDGTTASGNYSFVAGGLSNSASGVGSSAFGFGNQASGQTSMSWGNGNIASGDNATAFGNTNYARGDNTIGFGVLCEIDSLASESIAFGHEVDIYADYAIGIGKDIDLVSTANYSMFIGISDSLDDDSTFCSSYPHNEFRGQVTIDSMGVSQLLISSGTNNPIMSFFNYKNIGGYNGGEMAYNATFNGSTWVRNDSLFYAFCNFFNADTNRFDMYIIPPEGDYGITWGSEPTFMFDANGIFYPNYIQSDSAYIGVLYADTNTIVNHAVADTYYTVTGLKTGTHNNFTATDSMLTIPYTGFYRISFSISATHATNNTIIHASVYQNNTHISELEAQRKIATGGDVGNYATSGNYYFSAGDKIRIRTKADNTGNQTIAHMNISINRLN